MKTLKEIFKTIIEPLAALIALLLAGVLYVLIKTFGRKSTFDLEKHQEEERGLSEKYREGCGCS